MEGLPLLPGYSFRDPTQTRFHLSQQFDFKYGYAQPRRLPWGTGLRLLDTESVAYLKDMEPVRYDPSLTYGRVKHYTQPQFIPQYVHYDKKCLRFYAFFKQSVFESPLEHYRVRHVNIIYFLEDDTITVMEPSVENSGLTQGRLIKRDKIPKNVLGDHWHWKDLNIGMDVGFYGTVFHIVDCDNFTKEYLESQGIEISDTEELPPDPYILDRQMRTKNNTRKTPALDNKLRRFLEFDGKILRFFAVWDDRNSEFGELRSYVVYYFLADDVVQVQEVRRKNDGRDPFPLLLNKMKLPKDWKDLPADFPTMYCETTDEEVSEYYQPKDFVVGNTIFILGRRFLLYDTDKFTRDYYEKMLKITQPGPIEVFEKEKCTPQLPIPPHVGFGTPEDSYQSCLSFMPKPPKKDVVRYVMNASKYLRYNAVLDWVHPEDEIRRFVIQYSLSDCKLTIKEPPIRNSGIIGGTFLKGTLVSKPGTSRDFPEYYTPSDFYIGAKVLINQHRFIITGADLYVYRYMQDNPDKFPAEVIDNVRGWCAGQGLLKEDIQCRLEEQEEATKEDKLLVPCE